MGSRTTPSCITTSPLAFRASSALKTTVSIVRWPRCSHTKRRWPRRTPKVMPLKLSSTVLPWFPSGCPPYARTRPRHVPHYGHDAGTRTRPLNGGGCPSEPRPSGGSRRLPGWRLEPPPGGDLGGGDIGASISLLPPGAPDQMFQGLGTGDPNVGIQQLLQMLAIGKAGVGGPGSSGIDPGNGPIGNSLGF